MRFLTSNRLFAVLTVLALLLPMVLLAQNATTGAISGTVTDPSDAVVANAAVTLTNTGTGVSSNSVTNSNGAFGFPLLIPGNYKITVKQQGFRTTEQSVPVAVGQ